MIENNSFEQASADITPGLPADWAVSSLGTGEARADISGEVGSPMSGYESFDHGWTLPDVQTFIPELALVVKGFVEEMSRWIDHVIFMSLGSTLAAEFNDHKFVIEDFLSGWSTVDADVSLSDSEVATAEFGEDTKERFIWYVQTSSLPPLLIGAQFESTTAERFILSAWPEDA